MHRVLYRLVGFHGDLADLHHDVFVRALSSLPTLQDPSAFKGWPLSSDLTIKVKGYQVVLAIIDFQATKDAIDAADLAMAKLVLTRL